MEAITAAIGHLMTVVGTMLDQVTGAPVLCLFFVSSLVGTACGVLRKLKHI